MYCGIMLYKVFPTFEYVDEILASSFKKHFFKSDSINIEGIFKIFENCAIGYYNSNISKIQ